MNMVVVWSGLGVDSRLREDLAGDGLDSTSGFQHGIEPLARPSQHAPESREGDPVGRRPHTVVGGPELLPEGLWSQEPGQLLVLVEPVAQGGAHGGGPRGGPALMGRVPIS